MYKKTSVNQTAAMDERANILYNGICLFTAGSIRLGEGRNSRMYRLAEIMKDPVFIAAALAVLVLFVVIILIVYNHKTNIQTRTLKSIDRRMAEGAAEPKVQAAPEEAAAETALAAESETEETEAVPAETCGDSAEGLSIEELAAKAAEDARRSEEMEEEKAREKRSRMYNVGKSGRVYSKEELEALIKN
jgi:hypothetical protein